MSFLITKRKCGKLNFDVLVVLDFDETIVHADGRQEDFTTFSKLAELGMELCIASRNDRYYLESQLTQLGILGFFRYVMADFRPKSIQMKHILWHYEKKGCKFNRVLFVDDHLPNIERVRNDLPSIQCLQFGHEIHSLAELIDFTR